MSNTSQKHRNFVSEPMRNKPVTDLPGVGNATGHRLNAAGHMKANDVLGEYLVMKGDQQKFTSWMQGNFQANPNHAKATHNGLKEWTDNFL